jgi:hypothetical protein
MIDEQGWYNLAGAFVGAGGTLVCWLMNRTVSRHDKEMDDFKKTLQFHEKKHNECELNLANFRTDVAREYAKDSSVQQSLARLHEHMEEGFTEIRTDIKTILSRVK